MVSTLIAPSTVSTALPLPQQLGGMDLGRLRAYRENLEFYQGRQWTETQRRRDRRLTFNYAKAVIEKTASYPMSALSFAVDPEDGCPEALGRARRPERPLRGVYETNALDQMDFDNEIDCSVRGDAACKVTWDPAEKRVRVSAPDVQGLYAWWLADDPSRVWRVASRYVLGHEEAEMLLGPLPPSRKAAHTVGEGWTDGEVELWLA